MLFLYLYFVLRIITIQLEYLVKILVQNPKYFLSRTTAVLIQFISRVFHTICNVHCLGREQKIYVWKDDCDLVSCLVTGYRLTMLRDASRHRFVHSFRFRPFVVYSFMWTLNIWPPSKNRLLHEEEYGKKL